MIKNSKLLEMVLEEARFLSTGNIVTEDAFVAALFNIMLYTQGKMSLEEAQVLRAEFVQHGFSMAKAPAFFKEFIDNDSKPSMGEAISFQNKMFESKKRSAEAGNEENTPNMLLKCILEAPTPVLQKYIRSEDTDSELDEEVLKRLEEAFDKLFPLGESEESDQSSETKPDIKHNSKRANEKTTALKKTLKEIKSIRNALSNSVFGQDQAISMVTEVLFQAEIQAKLGIERNKPKAAFLFAGPPGVGKTFLAGKIAEALKLPFKRFDMSEYVDKEANLEFAGSDKVYKNGAEGNVTGFVEKNPSCVLLFDEIEKANISVIHLFLQILDEGQLRDNFTDQEVSFKDAVIIMTTNAGKQLYDQSTSTDYSSLSRKVIINALQKDRDPHTGVPFFPAAICSRFASGNVVMFNHIQAHDLLAIAKKEIKNLTGDFEQNLGIEIDIHERVYSALLFSEGGHADARTIKRRAEAFFFSELFELFRLIDGRSESELSDIETIRCTVSLPDDNEIRTLFEPEVQPRLLIAGSEDCFALCKKQLKGYDLVNCQSAKEAKAVLDKNDVQMILLEFGFGAKENEQSYLNSEDVESKVRSVFEEVKNAYREIPVYLLLTDGARINEEEMVSFYKQGIRGFLDIGKKTAFRSDVADLCTSLYQQHGMLQLAKSNRVVSFGTAQMNDVKKKTAEIRLIDFKIEAAVDAEDSSSLLGSLSRPNVSFSQVIGAEDAKEELQFFVDYLKNPKKFYESGVREPRGVILYGPPGTGKTMLAKAMAHESGVTFISAEGNQFLQKFQGVGKDQVHELFHLARKYAPSIIFIDEIDAIAKERAGGSQASSNGEDVLTAFLTEMDGFKNHAKQPVFVLAATNFDVEPGGGKSLDPALMRRFDRRIFVDLPTKEERIKYISLKVSQSSIFDVSEDAIDNLAIRSTGMSLADLESVIELSLRNALRTNAKVIDDIAMEDAFESFQSGEEKKWDMQLLERVARHEAGHALLCWLSGETPSYVTIVSRGNHGGYMQHGDQEGKTLYTKNELLSRVRTALGGRAAEIVYYGREEGISTGASGDLQNATALVQQMICTYGMSEEFGLTCIPSATAMSGELFPLINEAMKQVLNDEMEKAISIISENKDKMERLVDALLNRNHLIGKEIEAILNA